jgi:hypothetical protein
METMIYIPMLNFVAFSMVQGIQIKLKHIALLTYPLSTGDSHLTDANLCEQFKNFKLIINLRSMELLI